MAKEKANKKAKKEKAPLEPQYFTSETGMQTYNYGVYYMKPLEKILYFVLAFIVGAVAGYIFYGGLAKDEFNDPTKMTYILNVTICSICGIIAGKLYIPIRTKQILQKRKNQLKMQFRELLDNLSTSVSSGKTINDSFLEAKGDMILLFSEEAFIVNELEVIAAGVANNINIEVMLLDLGRRSHIEDIDSFGNVFDTCYRKGGDMKDVIRNTQKIISDKIEVEMEIETMVTSSKTEQKIMMFMPFGIVGMIKGMSPELAHNFATPAGIIATTIGAILLVVSYFIGQKVLDIKI